MTTTKKTIAILLAVLFLVSLTASAVSAAKVIPFAPIERILQASDTNGAVTILPIPGGSVVAPIDSNGEKKDKKDKDPIKIKSHPVLKSPLGSSGQITTMSGIIKKGRSSGQITTTATVKWTNK